MGLGQRRAETPCFCNEQCPAGTFPFRNYWVSAHSEFGPDYGNDHVLFTFNTTAGDQCIWQTPVDHFPLPSVETLTRIPLVAPDGFQAWRWMLFVLEGLNTNIWTIDLVYAVPEVGSLVEPEAPASCSRRSFILNQVVPTSPGFATVDAAYPDACDDGDYPAKIIRKPQVPF